MESTGKDWLLMAFGIIGAIADGLSTPLTLFITSKFMNSLGASSDISIELFVHSINKSAVAILYLACGKFIACLLVGYCWTRTAERQVGRMRANYLKAVLRQEIGYFDSHVTSSADVVTTISTDILLIQNVLSEKVPNLLGKVSTFVGSCTLSFILLWRLAVVSLPFLVLLPIPSLVVSRAVVGMSMKWREEYQKKAGEIAEQAVSSIRSVYANVGETRTVSEFSKALEGSVKVGIKQGLSKGLAIGSNGMVYCIWAFMSWYGSRLVIYHGAHGGTIFAVVASITTGGRSLGDALHNLNYFIEAHVATKRMAEVLKRVPEIDSYDNEGRILGNVEGEIEFRHLKFAYPTRPDDIVFKDFCLKVPARKTLALVGSSGSGKSTVVSLLQRFYDPISGEILLDGVGIRELQLKWLRSQIGVVSQEPALFASSVKENILFGKEDATMDEIVEVSKASNAHSFICQLPQGYETQVGERGIQMSGGQKQRIAIARAIIKSPKILLLDEATSALDSESENIVQKSLEDVSVGRTTIIIAHRLSTIRNADIIVVVKDGIVVETGSHEDLMENWDGSYASLMRLQQMNIETPLKDNTVTSGSGSTTPTLVSQVEEKERALGRISKSDSQAHEAFPRPTFGRLLKMNRPEWKQAVMGCICAAIYGAVTPVFAFSQGSMVSVYFLKSQKEIEEKTRIYSLCFVGLGTVCLLVNIAQHYNFAYMGEYLTKRIRERMLMKVLTFEVGWFDKEENSSGVVCSSIAKEANTVRSLVGDRVSLLVEALSTVTIASIIGLIIAWRLAIVMIAVQPLVIMSYYMRKVLLQQTSKRASKAQVESSNLVADAVFNIRTITAFSSHNRVLKMLERSQEGPRRENVKQSWVTGIVLAISSSLASCIWALDFWYCGKLISQKHVTAGAVFEAFMILVTTGWVIAEAGGMTTDLVKGLDSVKYVFGVLDRKTAIDPHDPQGYQPENIVGDIVFRDVKFSYPTRPEMVIFREFSIHLVAGKSTAIVGTSGSGKSTIISLIERFYDPVSGVIEIDGMDLKSYNLCSLRKHIALVSQEPTLFGDTIRANIVYGISGEIDESEIVEAAKAANAHDFIASLKNGYTTLCGGRGLLLSGGQKQRIAIARAILRNPKVLLLDEATSALDGRSEKAVQDALERMMVGRTSVIVAHRLSTIQNADMIAVLDNGKIVEKGTHDSLLAMGSTGAYYSLVNLQLQKNSTQVSDS